MALSSRLSGLPFHKFMIDISRLLALHFISHFQDSKVQLNASVPSISSDNLLPSCTLGSWQTDSSVIQSKIQVSDQKTKTKSPCYNISCKIKVVIKPQKDSYSICHTHMSSPNIRFWTFQSSSVDNGMQVFCFGRCPFTWPSFWGRRFAGLWGRRCASVFFSVSSERVFSARPLLHPEIRGKGSRPEWKVDQDVWSPDWD